MSEVTVLIGPAGSLRSDGTARATVPISQGFMLVPVDEAAWDLIGAALAEDPDAAADRSKFLAFILRGAGLRADPASRIAYLESGKFDQVGLVAVGDTVTDSYTTEFDGSQSQTPERDWAFNRALRRIGVKATDTADEGEAVGLTRYLTGRSTS